MAGKLGRRTVYLGTIVGAVALVAGFALAAGFTNTPVSSNQNGYSANVGDTVWHSASPVTLAPGTSSNTCSATTSNTPSLPATSSLPVTLGTPTTGSFYYGMSGSGSVCSANDFAEAWTFVLSVTATATDTDNFVIYSDWTQVSTPTSAVAADSITMTITGSGTSVVTLILVVDFGSNAPPTSITGMDVVVTGS
jgi:hypothetical protein